MDIKDGAHMGVRLSLTKGITTMPGQLPFP